MSLIGKWFLTDQGDIDISGGEHVDMVIAAMLLMDRRYAPHLWNSKGIPEEEFGLALERGARPAAVEFSGNLTTRRPRWRAPLKRTGGRSIP